MNYFKNIVRNVYQNMIEDEYIEPLTQQQIYTTINSNYQKRNNYSKDKNKNINIEQLNPQQQLKKQIIELLERSNIVKPEVEFGLLGNQPALQRISMRVRQIDDKLVIIKHFMVLNYSIYYQNLQNSIQLINVTNTLINLQQRNKQLIKKIKYLQELSKNIKIILQLNIKIKNIKSVIKILQKIPNIKKMNLIQLNGINIIEIQKLKKTIYQNSKYKQLYCIKHLQDYIQQAGNDRLKIVIQSISQCLINFNNQIYQHALKGYIITQTQIEYPKLLIKLIQRQIRDQDIFNNKIQYNNNNQINNKNIIKKQSDLEILNFVQLCRFYIKIMINLHKIFRWHKNNQVIIQHERQQNTQQSQSIDLRRLSIMSNVSGSSEIDELMISLNGEESIKINIYQIKNKICQCIDEQLQEQVYDRIGAINKNYCIIYQYLYVVERSCELAHAFAGYKYQKTIKNIKKCIEHLLDKIMKKGINQITQALNLEDNNKWHRLPVPNNYRSRIIDHLISRIKRIKCSIVYKNMMKQGQFYYLNNENMENHINKNIYEKQNWQIQYNRLDDDDDSNSQYINTIDESIAEFSRDEVVICQSSLLVINYLHTCSTLLFYIPINTFQEKVVQSMLFLIKFEIYYIFINFLSNGYQKYILGRLQDLQDKYLQKRLNVTYNKLCTFIHIFRRNILQGNEQQGTFYKYVNIKTKQSPFRTQDIIRQRVISTESIIFLIANLQYLIKYTIDEPSQLYERTFKSIQQLKIIRQQLAELLFTDCYSIAKVSQTDVIQPLLKKIKWYYDYNEISDYVKILINSFKQVYQRMRSHGKGEIPIYLTDQIFTLFWKHQLTYITRCFLLQHMNWKHRGSRNAKLNFSQFTQQLYIGMKSYLHKKQQGQDIYLRIKGIIPILEQNSWNQCIKMLKQSLRQYEFVYKVVMGILQASQCCCNISNGELQNRKKQLDAWIVSEIL